MTGNRNYRQDRAALVTGSGWLPKRTQDRFNTTRSDAANWAAGVAIIAGCLYVLGWGILALFVSVPVWTFFLFPPVAVVLGASFGSLKLIRFTEEYRDFVYALEEETGLDIDGDGVTGPPVIRVGSPPQGTLLRGLDGAMHAVDTTLTSADILAVKASLLANNTYSVRALNSALGDENRASGLRLELYRLGIIEQPKPKQATRLTAAGIKAVRRW